MLVRALRLRNFSVVKNASSFSTITEPPSPSQNKSGPPKQQTTQQKAKPGVFSRGVVGVFKDAAKTPGQKRLARDLERGNLWEWHQISHTSGRVLVPTLVDPAREQVFFPDSLSYGMNMNGKLVDLKDELLQHPLSLVLVSQKRLITAFMSEAWRKALKTKYPDMPIFEVIALQHWGYKIFNPVTNARLRRHLNSAELSRVIRIRNAALVDLDPNVIGINVENSYAVYAFLIDSVGRIRWKAGGRPNDADAHNLILSTELILKADAMASEQEKERRAREIQRREQLKRDKLKAADD